MDFGVKRPLFGKEIPMRTVNEVSKLTGVSIRTLQYYDSIGLLKPTEYTEVGYRLYDEEALERLQQILLFRELEFPLKEIKDIIYNPKFNKEKVLEQQIELLVLKKEHIENLIDFARRIKTMGVNKTYFKVFDKKKMEDYSKRAKEQWGQIAQYQEFEEKTKGVSDTQQKDVINRFMLIFTEFGKIKELCKSRSHSTTCTEF